jgi:hypothetical protein
VTAFLKEWTMRTRFVMMLSMLLLSASAGAAPAVPPAPKAPVVAGIDDQIRARALKDGWPDTPAGLVAFAWVDAFSSGDDAMRAFHEQHLSKASLEKRPMSERLATYRAARQQLGTLELASIEDSKPDELTASLLAEDATQHRFVFKVEPQSPHYLVSISTFETVHGGHGGHGGH